MLAAEDEAGLVEQADGGPRHRIPLGLIAGRNAAMLVGRGWDAMGGAWGGS